PASFTNTEVTIKNMRRMKTTSSIGVKSISPASSLSFPFAKPFINTTCYRCPVVSWFVVAMPYGPAVQLPVIPRQLHTGNFIYHVRQSYCLQTFPFPDWFFLLANCLRKYLTGHQPCLPSSE